MARKLRFDQDALFAQGLRGCNKCGEIKSVDDFHSDKSRKYNLAGICRKCSKYRYLDWYKNNPEKAKIINDRYRRNHLERDKIRHKIYRKNNPEIYRKSTKKYREKNKSKVIEMNMNVVKNVTNGYAVGIIKRQFDIPTSEITPDMIMLKKVEIKSKRMINNHKKQEL